MNKNIRQRDFYLTPNILSVSRILVVPLVILFLYFEWNWWTLILFILVGLTDWVDGYLARRYKEESRLGMLLDPLADKLIIISTMIMLLWLGRLDLQVDLGLELDLLGPVLVVVTVGRELAVTGLRAMASTAGISMPADRGGKIKTSIQFLAICFLIAKLDPFLLIGQILLIISVVAALWSGIRYFFGFVKGLPA